MSDVKRPTLSFNSHKVDDKKSRDLGRTVRILLALPESNEDTYPEYNYKEELAAAKKKDKAKCVLPTTNGLDPFNEDDDDVRRIALEMEAKYGVGGPKKRRKGRRDDYADIGMGYDESDSFIDNTDGYDEMIPQNVTTVLGGFYINSGELEFKAVDDASSEVSTSSSSEDEVDETGRTNGAKRMLSTDSEGEKETENEVEPVEKKPKLQTNGDVPKIVKKKLFNSEKLKEMKKRKEEKKKSATVKELLKEKRNETNSVGPEDRIPEKSEKEESKDSMKENKKPVPIDNISDIIESVVKSVDDSLIRQATATETKPPPERATVVESDGESSHDGGELPVNIVKLPENLPNEIVEIVDRIKELASKNTDGKLKFFTRSVNEFLLRLERSCKCLGKQSRLKIYEHLAPYVRLKKETLIKRAKNLMLEEEQRKLKTLIDRLKGDIDNTMPGLLQNYERDSQKVMQKKESLINEENKQLRMPKRKYSWTEDTRRLVKDIATLRKKCFILEGRSKDYLESIMIDYLKSNIQTLWPEGWMSMTVLRKICNNVLQHDVKKSTAASSSNNLPISSDILPSKEIQMLSANTNLSITPVVPTAAKLTENAIPVNITKSDITINKIENPQISPSSGCTKVSPDIVKCSSASLTITPTIVKPDKLEKELKPKQEKEYKSEPEKEFKPKQDDFIIIDDATPPRPKIEMKLDFGKKESHHEPVKKAESCQIIDLTDQINAERRKREKAKQKYYEPLKEEYPPKTSNHIPSIEDIQNVPQNLSNKQHSSKNEMIKHDFSRPKSADGDDIQKVMEDLKVLQKMSSPVKASESLTSSPVSVIAYNKSYSPKNMLSHPATSHRNDFNKSDFTSGFQDVFQRQLYNDFSLLANPNHSAPTASKSHYNSSDKYVHSSSPGFINEKFYQGSNNNFPQNSNKIKNLPQQTGHLPKQSQK